MPLLSADGISARERRTLMWGAVAVACVLLTYAMIPFVRAWSDRESLIEARRVELARLHGVKDAESMLQAAVAPEFTRHHERLNGGSVKYAFELDSRGRVVSLKAHSTKNSRWGEGTLARIIRSGGRGTRTRPI